MTPGAWFPDRASGAGTRPVDHRPGQRDQAPAAADASTRRVYADAQLRAGFRSKHLVVDDQAISWGDEVTPFAVLTAYSAWVTRVSAGPAQNYEYWIRLWAGRDDSTILFGGRDERCRRAYDGAARALFEHSGIGHLEELRRRVHAGEKVALADWTFSRAGAACGRREVAWSEPIELRPSTKFAGQMVYVTRDGKTRPVAAISAKLAGGPLLRPAFELLQADFRG